MKFPATTPDLLTLIASDRHQELMRSAHELRQAAEARGAHPELRRTRRRFLRR